MPEPFIDIEELAEFYPDEVVIESFATTRNARHQAVEDWAPVTGLAALKGRLKFVGGKELQGSGQSSAPHSGGAQSGVQSAIYDHEIKLKGYFPQIKSSMRARVAGQIFEIRAVAHAGMKTRSRLLCSRGG